MVFNGTAKLNSKGYCLLCFTALLLIYYIYLPDRDPKISLAELLKTSIQAAELGGKFVVSQKNDLHVQSKGKTKEGLQDSVTNADFLSHCAMKNLLTSSYPDVKFISEEKEAVCNHGFDSPEQREMPDVKTINSFVKAKDVTLWIDPLDATHEYTEKLYQYVTTMVCVAIKGEPVIGVIHNPFSGETFWAVVGFDHSDNLKGFPKRQGEKIKIIISRSHQGAIEDVLKRNFKDYELIVAAGAGYKSLKVADGSADAYLHITAIKKWDICAGNAILKELGGKMTTKKGNTLTYYNESGVVNEDGLIAAIRYHNMFVNKL